MITLPENLRVAFHLQLGDSPRRVAMPMFIAQNCDAMNYARSVATESGVRVRVVKSVWSDEHADYRRFELTEEDGQIVEREVRS